MIKGIIVSNGTLRLVLIGESDIDKATLKALDGATCKLVTDNLKLFDQTVADGLVIQADPAKGK